jgi:DNA-binding HxlR family transcriptional regulator
MKSYGQLCAVARALDVVGDRWTLLMVRELLIQGQARFTDLQSGLPGIAPNLLTQRLRDLVAAGVLTKQTATPPASGTVYSLTERGRALEGVVRELLKWGAPTVPDAPHDAHFQMHWLSQPARYLLRDHRPSEGRVVIRFGDARDGFDVTVEHGMVHTGPCHAQARPSATVGGPGPALVALVQGALPLDRATDASVTITGDQEAVRRVLPPPLDTPVTDARR